MSNPTEHPQSTLSSTDQPTFTAESLLSLTLEAQRTTIAEFVTALDTFITQCKLVRTRCRSEFEFDDRAAMRTQIDLITAKLELVEIARDAISFISSLDRQPGANTVSLAHSMLRLGNINTELQAITREFDRKLVAYWYG
ncbi:hypothetical protein Q9L58_009032 [Maublancomyces gigas]|uniref:Uncharacterized protein n=1 Tax=Discina gigas TaxID=1032678 RepID=A0ABR3G829_9PEZI